jgi:general secretion pathway protein I
VAEAGAARTGEPGEQGFTLIEVLVALVILAVASAGVIGAAEAHLDTARGLQSRAVAQWVAENRIAELTVERGSPVKPFDIVEMLGESWTVQITRRPTEDREIEALTIAVGRPETTSPLIMMDFFRELPGSTGA